MGANSPWEGGVTPVRVSRPTFGAEIGYLFSTTRTPLGAASELVPSKDARLFAGDGFLNLLRHGQEAARFGKAWVVGRQGQIDKLA
jgi:hypothetical protein